MTGIEPFYPLLHALQESRKFPFDGRATIDVIATENGIVGCLAPRGS